ncbi:MAG: hypothetical protein HY883_02670 [Deltaproteobacteria bacterium]|nr:hypothetical protein [Deltaproteobacteria bacterium]
MKKIVFGFIIGVIMLILFIAFGGGEYLKSLGRKTEEAGERLGTYQRKVKQTAEKAQEKLNKTKEMAEEALKEEKGKGSE